eukprot:543105-Pyramimonas_sp.AAC.1
MLSEAFSFDSDSHARKELYEIPGGNQIDDSPLAPVRAEGGCVDNAIASAGATRTVKHARAW